MAWRVEGSYFENCSCQTMCQCIFQSYPEEGQCDAGIAWHIEDGDFQGISLDDLNIVAVVNAPFKGPGKGEMFLYVDERASGPQGEALIKIFSGQAGGNLAIITSLIGKVTETRKVPIQFVVQGDMQTVRIPQVLDMELDAATASDVRKGPYLAKPPNCFLTHFPLYVSSSRKGTYNDRRKHWDNGGKTSFFGKFAYSG